LILSFSCSFHDFVAFYAFCWLLRFFLLLGDILKLLLAFGRLAVLHGVLDSNFKLHAFVINGLIKGEIEKLSGQFLGLMVMSH
jgi:hypothetical protein